MNLKSPPGDEIEMKVCLTGASFRPADAFTPDPPTDAIEVFADVERVGPGDVLFVAERTGASEGVGVMIPVSQTTRPATLPTSAGAAAVRRLRVVSVPGRSA